VSDVDVLLTGRPLITRGLRAPRAALQSAIARREVRAAVKQARRFRSRAGAGAVRVCWDLDNTLVGSGKLLRAGRRLEAAIVDAEPVPNMLDLYGAIRAEIPNAEYFILSARMRRMRPDTLAWLSRHGLIHAGAAVCFVPYVQAKARVWEQLAGRGALVIVDDLSYDHESDHVSTHDELVDLAERIANIYIGLEEIAEIAADPKAVGALVSRTVESLVD
jgi:hypothetical protein